MSASDRTLIGGTLVAMCLVVNGAATAMEPTQPAATPVSPALSFRVFLDERRLADLQEAWSARVARPGPSRAEAATRDARQLEKAQATVSTARAAMKRAEQASEDAAVVRRRAEEISRLFSAGAVTATPARGKSAAIATVATVDAGGSPAPQVEHSAVHAPPRDADAVAAKPFGIGGPPPADATESAQHAAVQADTPTAKPARALVPPNPHRGPKVSAGKTPRSKAKVGTNAKSGSSAKLAANSRPAAPAANVRPADAPASAPPPSAQESKSSTMSEVFSGFIRAFGWNSQPE